MDEKNQPSIWARLFGHRLRDEEGYTWLTFGHTLWRRAPSARRWTNWGDA